MAPSKLPVMQSLSSQFLRFGFNLEGVARCLHTTNWVCRDVDGTSAANNLHNSVIAECGDRFCSRDHSHQVKAFYVAAANGAALARGGNGPAGISTLSTHNLQFPSSIVQARASCSGSLRLILPPAFRSLRPHCNGSTFSYGVFVRGVRTLAADIKPGNVVELKGKLQEVVKTVWTMQGRGSSSIQVELRDVSSGTKNVDKWRPETAVERVILEDREFTFLYDDGASAVLMDPKTFDQAAVDKVLFGEARSFLKDGMAVKVAFHGETPVTATLPPQVRCRVVEAAPTFKTERKTASTKMVTLDTGTRIQVPGFIEEGEEVLVKTADMSFVARAKGE